LTRTTVFHPVWYHGHLTKWRKVTSFSMLWMFCSTQISESGTSALSGTFF